jgi:hypothetical protein
VIHRPVAARRAGRALLLSLGVGLLIAVAGAGAAVADEVEYDDDTITISVTIEELEPCTAGAPGCPGDGELAFTGTTVGVPLGIAVLLAALGAGAYGLAAHRRSPDHG